jgi:hypothetical protein
MVQIRTELTLDASGTNAYVNFDPSLNQSLNPFARHEWVRIGKCNDHTGDTRLNDGLGTGPCLAVVATRFERGVHRRATSVIAGCGQSIYLSVRPAVS